MTGDRCRRPQAAGGEPPRCSDGPSGVSGLADRHGRRAAVAMAGIAASLLPRAFLPPFNEGTFTINMPFNPGISLAESQPARAASPSSCSCRSPRGEDRSAAAPAAPSSTSMPKASIQPRSRSISSHVERRKEDVIADIRDRLADLPASVNVGQPISHRLDHMLSGVRAQIALKIFGDDLDTLRAPGRTSAPAAGGDPGPGRPPGREAGADSRSSRSASITRRAALYGVQPAAVIEQLEPPLERPRGLAGRRRQPPLRRGDAAVANRRAPRRRSATS